MNFPEMWHSEPDQAGTDPAGVFRSFFERSGLCVANTDRETRITEVNDEFARQFDRPAADLGGTPVAELLHPDARDETGRQFAHLLAGRRTWFTERIVARRPGDASEFTGELTGIGLRGDDGETKGVMVMVRPERQVHRRRRQASGRASLTDMDARVLEGVAAGVSTVQLASMLYLSRGGIEYHVNILLRKLKVNNRPALVSKAYSTGLLCIGSWPPRVHPDHVR
ncbi:PAS domain-containing protein [Actinomadura welshii]